MKYVEYWAWALDEIWAEIDQDDFIATLIYLPIIFAALVYVFFTDVVSEKGSTELQKCY